MNLQSWIPQLPKNPFYKDACVSVCGIQLSEAAKKLWEITHKGMLRNCRRSGAEGHPLQRLNSGLFYVPCWIFQVSKVPTPHYWISSYPLKQIFCYSLFFLKTLHNRFLSQHKEWYPSPSAAINIAATADKSQQLTFALFCDDTNLVSACLDQLLKMQGSTSESRT